MSRKECDYCGSVGAMHYLAFYNGFSECDPTNRDVCDKCLLPFFKEAIKDAKRYYGGNEAIIQGMRFDIVNNLVEEYSNKMKDRKNKVELTLEDLKQILSRTIDISYELQQKIMKMLETMTYEIRDNAKKLARLEGLFMDLENLVLDPDKVTAEQVNVPVLNKPGIGIVSDCSFSGEARTWIIKLKTK